MMSSWNEFVTSMAYTIFLIFPQQEAEKILENENIDEDAKTRGDQERIDAAKAESEPPKVPRENTMVATAAVSCF